MTGGPVSPEQIEDTPTSGAAESAPLAEAVRNALQQTAHGWLQRVAVTVEAGSVVLRGKLPSFYLKQVAQTIVLAVPGVGTLRNELNVEAGR
jgi:osmotically-inducible protein OsmY